MEEDTNEDFNVSRALQNDFQSNLLKIQFEMAVTRCLDKAAPDTCEEFHKYTFRRFCKMMKIPGPWIAYLATMEPPYGCPTKKVFT